MAFHILKYFLCYSYIAHSWGLDGHSHSNKIITFLQVVSIFCGWWFDINYINFVTREIQMSGSTWNNNMWTDPTCAGELLEYTAAMCEREYECIPLSLLLTVSLSLSPLEEAQTISTFICPEWDDADRSFQSFQHQHTQCWPSLPANVTLHFDQPVCWVCLLVCIVFLPAVSLLSNWNRCLRQLTVCTESASISARN